MTLKALTLGAFALSCALGTPRPAPKPQRIVAGTGIFQSVYAWQRTPWWRVSDIAPKVPIYVIVSTDGWACRVDAADWVLAVPNELYACESGWINPRRR